MDCRFILANTLLFLDLGTYEAGVGNTISSLSLALPFYDVRLSISIFKKGALLKVIDAFAMVEMHSAHTLTADGGEKVLTNAGTAVCYPKPVVEVNFRPIR